MDTEKTMEPNLKLSKNEQKLYKTLEEYYQNNKYFSMLEAFSYLKERHKIPDKDIMIFLDRLVQNKMVVEKKFLSTETLMLNKNRHEIYDYISKNPGLTFDMIVKAFKLPNFVLNWHLEILNHFNLIKEKKYLIYTIYYHKYFPKDKEVIIFSLRDPKVLNIYVLLLNELFDVYSLSKILEIPEFIVKYFLIKLENNGLITKSKDNAYSINISDYNFLKDYFDFTLSDFLKEKINDFKDLAKITYMIISNKKSGVSLFEYNFFSELMDSDLIGGFISAIQQFGSELSKQSTTIKKIEYKEFEICVEDGKWVRTALIMKGKSSESIDNRMKDFLNYFENTYSTKLDNWTGDVSVFKDSKYIIEDFFSPKTEREKKSMLESLKP